MDANISLTRHTRQWCHRIPGMLVHHCWVRQGLKQKLLFLRLIYLFMPLEYNTDKGAGGVVLLTAGGGGCGPHVNSTECVHWDGTKVIKSPWLMKTGNPKRKANLKYLGVWGTTRGPGAPFTPRAEEINPDVTARSFVNLLFGAAWCEGALWMLALQNAATRSQMTLRGEDLLSILHWGSKALWETSSLWGFASSAQSASLF